MTKMMPHTGMRPVIAIIGNRNAGKSTLLNRIVGQEVSIVSPEKGTTTDAVVKTYELIPAGPVSFYDTAGLDDDGTLGALRVKASHKILSRADLVLAVIGKEGLTPDLEQRINELRLKNIPCIPVFNYADIEEISNHNQTITELYDGIKVSARTGDGIETLKSRMADLLIPLSQENQALKGLVHAGDTVLLVTPIDLAAPKGRMIMPQVQILREVLDNNAIALTVKETELPQALALLKNPPALIITDSQAVKEVAATVPENIPLTTFSMLLARAKGDFAQMLKGAEEIDKLPNGAKILIAEGCSHRLTCDDIGRVKIPGLIRNKTNRDFVFEFTSGNDFPEDLTPYALVIHCGGCVLNRAEIRRRLRQCTAQNIPVTNYGMVISLMQGVLPRTVAPLKAANNNEDERNR